jgi:hypothetical protein
MYVVTIPNRASPPAVLLRESFREGGRIKNRTLANLSQWPRDKVEALLSSAPSISSASGPSQACSQ